MTSANDLHRTPLHQRHVSLGARMVDFAGWEMPLNYPTGVVAEHLATRGVAGLFDVSHMGRFSVSGPGAATFLSRLLTNDAAMLQVGRAHYTLLATESGGAIDDAYLYRFHPDEYLLVVNASNRQKDLGYLLAESTSDDVQVREMTAQLAMIAVQGPRSEEMLSTLLETGSVPEARRNALSIADIGGAQVMMGRTGYTGEPVCFELFVPAEQAQRIWDMLVAEGAVPTGLGARDTLRLEAALPLYGHEQGLDPAGNEIPLLSCPVAAHGVSLSGDRGEFVGREALVRQQEAYRRIARQDYSDIAALPRLVRPVAVVGRGIARAGATVTRDGKDVGWVTSGTMVPYWKALAQGAAQAPGGEHDLRSICLAYLDSRVSVDDQVTVEVRGKDVQAVVVERHLRSDMPPYALPVLHRVAAGV